MSKKRFNCEQVRTVFIEVGAEGMPERMAGEPAGHPQFCFFGRNKLVDGIGNHMLLWVIGLWEKPAGWFSIRKPVGGEGFECQGGKECIAVRACFGAADMDTHAGAADILVTQGTDFANPQACGIHEGEDCFVFQV